MDGIIGINLGSGPWSFPGWVGVDARHLEVSEHLDEHSRLLFPDNSLSYVFSSHFFEHINDATAQNLMNESARVLRPGGILRITVPDYELVLDRYHHGDHDFFDRGDWNMTPRYENWRGCGIEPTPETKLVYAFANYATESAPPDLWPPWHYIPGYYNGPPKIDDNEVRDAAARLDAVAFSAWAVTHIPLPYRHTTTGHRNAYTMEKFDRMLTRAGFRGGVRSGFRQSQAPALRDEAFDNRPGISMFVEAVKP